MEGEWGWGSDFLARTEKTLRKLGIDDAKYKRSPKWGFCVNCRLAVRHRT